MTTKKFKLIFLVGFEKMTTHYSLMCCSFCGLWEYNYGMLGAQYKSKSSHGYIPRAYITEAQHSIMLCTWMLVESSQSTGPVLNIIYYLLLWLTIQRSKFYCPIYMELTFAYDTYHSYFDDVVASTKRFGSTIRHKCPQHNKVLIEWNIIQSSPVT